MGSARRRARVVALQALYELDCAGHDPTPSVWRLVEERHLSEDAAAFAQELVLGVVEHRVELDSTITRFAPSFPVDRLPVVDRNILRLAVLEMLFSRKVPVKVAINEAVELAKTFGGDNSPRFVNGVLGSVDSVVLQG